MDAAEAVLQRCDPAAVATVVTLGGGVALEYALKVYG